MCIRDSILSDRLLGGTGGDPRDVRHHGGLPNQGRLHDLQPVSYTHLRAHETVLDLVCRLLLEKKKNHITH